MVASYFWVKLIPWILAVPRWYQAQADLNNDGKGSGNDDDGLCGSLYGSFTKDFHVLLH